MSCGVSQSDEAKLKQAVSGFVSSWRSGSLEEIYERSDPKFRDISLDEWKGWKANIDTRWGILEDAKILDITRLAPGNDLFFAQTQMKYSRGSTRGSFGVAIHRDGSPGKVGAVLADLH